MRSSVLGGRADIDFEKIENRNGILGGAPETCSCEVPVKLREVPMKYYVYPWNAKFTREKPGLSGAPPELAQTQSFDRSCTVLRPKATNPRAQDTQLPAKKQDRG